MEPGTRNPLQTPVARRTVLVAAGASGLLVACGGSSDSSGTGGTGNEPSPAASGQVLATAADVPVGGGVVNKDLHVVVTQPTAGNYRAFTSICTHAGCDVGSISDNVITCPCHGSQFSAENGDVSRGPANAPLAAIAVAVQGGAIVRT
jgi:Rieske Fe-S protein